MKREKLLQMCLNNEDNAARAKAAMPIIYQRLYDEAKLGKGAIEMLWEYNEPTEAIILHQLKEDGYDIQYMSFEPRIVLISWI